MHRMVLHYSRIAFLFVVHPTITPLTPESLVPPKKSKSRWKGKVTSRTSAGFYSNAIAAELVDVLHKFLV